MVSDKQPKEELLHVRVTPLMKDELKIFVPNASSEIRDLVERFLEEKKLEAFAPFLDMIKGNRYAAPGLEVAIDDIVYYSGKGLKEDEIKDRVLELLVEKFEFSRGAAECFFGIYKKVYKDPETLSKCKAGILDLAKNFLKTS